MPDNFIIRNMPPGLRNQLKAQAALQGIPLNTLIIKVLQEYLKKER